MFMPSGLAAAAGVSKLRLLFAGDTFITITSPADTLIKNGEVSRLTYTARSDDNLQTRGVWRTGSGNNEFSFRRGSFGGEMEMNRSTSTFRSNLIHVLGVDYEIEELIDGVGGAQLTASGLGVDSGIGLSTVAAEANLVIGDGNINAQFWIGVISDFKIFNSSDVIVNHWPIDDDVGNGGTIVDVVGGVNGILTLGGGSWI